MFSKFIAYCKLRLTCLFYIICGKRWKANNAKHNAKLKINQDIAYDKAKKSKYYRPPNNL